MGYGDTAVSLDTWDFECSGEAFFDVTIKRSRLRIELMHLDSDSSLKDRPPKWSFQSREK